jgi:hypothetical protein
MDDTRTVEQLAMFMHERDVRLFRSHTAEKWADAWPGAREEYLRDAAAYVAGMRILGWAPAGTQPLDGEGRQNAIELALWLFEHHPTGEPDIAKAALTALKNLTGGTE